MPQLQVKLIKKISVDQEDSLSDHDHEVLEYNPLKISNVQIQIPNELVDDDYLGMGIDYSISLKEGTTLEYSPK